MADPTIPAAPPLLPWWVVPSIAYTIVMAFIGIAFVIVLRATDSSQYAQLVIAAIITLATGATGYYFGSSSGSEKKDTTIAASSAALATSAPATVSTAEPSDAEKALADRVTPAS